MYKGTIMKIYTSNFANLRKIPSDIVPISICAKSPHWFHGIEYKTLAPSYEILSNWKNNHDAIQYMFNFNFKILGHLHARKVVEDLSSLSRGNDLVLLCYENRDCFCHRHLVSQWLTVNGFPCKEFEFK